jgi:excinuclease ABC subunit A
MEWIRIRGARAHNLKSIDVDIPKGQLTVITGLSGSGKSSLAFDTLYAEGQRRYVESLSSYARQFLGRLDKPDVDRIDGLTPAIAIDQRSSAGGTRSTVGTRTEIHDYLRIIYARIGTTFSPISGLPVRSDRPEDVLDRILQEPEGRRFLVVAPQPAGRAPAAQAAAWQAAGFSRVLWEGEVCGPEDIPQDARGEVSLVIDRLAVGSGDDFTSRTLDSLESAFFEGAGTCTVQWPDTHEVWTFSDRFERDGRAFTLPTPALFAFNTPIGACPRCSGFGSVIGIDPDLVVPDPGLSIYSGAIACWRGERMEEWKNDLVAAADRNGIDVHAPWSRLSEEVRQKVWQGGKGFAGLNAFFEDLESHSYKIAQRVLLSRFRGKTTCSECHGTRLHPDTEHIRIDGWTIGALLRLPLDTLGGVLDAWALTEAEQHIARRPLAEVRRRVDYLVGLGLGYLTLHRGSHTLSGGEAQRIALSACIGSSLVGSTYVLDEPSIGLHPRDTERLIGLLRTLRDGGNSVVVVEHDEDMIRAADYVIDLGPHAGTGGGQLVFAGVPASADPADAPESLTLSYLAGSLTVPVPSARRPVGGEWIRLRGATRNNLRSVDADIPLHALTVVCGVSGSGKSTLISEVLVPLVRSGLDGTGAPTGVGGACGPLPPGLQAIEWVDQHPVGKSSRSNPATYVKAFEEIRALFANSPTARQRGLKPTHFSFNVPGGRCETCEGEGTVTVGMQFMADLTLTCEACGGKRYTAEVLDIRWNGATIADVLNWTVDDALVAFREEAGRPDERTGLRRLRSRIEPLASVGMGYIGLGQSTTTLSGGESQRMKLASFLDSTTRRPKTLFVFDEPTTGLHVHDVARLLDIFDRLIAAGHSVLAIEHHPDALARADWLIELGPEAGDAGGRVEFQGSPEALIARGGGHTALHLAAHVRRKSDLSVLPDRR